MQIFLEAGVETRVVETERSGHATEIVEQADLSQIDGIVCVSGDGLVTEVVNGLMSVSRL